MAKRSVGKPRFYADFPSYLKVLGYYTGSSSGGILGGNGTKISNLWNMNPVHTNKYEINHTYNGYNFGFTVSGDSSVSYPLTEENMELSQLLSQTNFAGILNHNLGTLKDPNGNTIEGIKLYYSGNYLDSQGDSKNTSANALDFTEIVNSDIVARNKIKPEYNGYSLWEIATMPKGDDPYVFGSIKMVILKQDLNQNEENLNTNESLQDIETDNPTVNIGAFTFGRYFEPEFAFDLQATLSTSYEGVKSQTSVGGSTLTNIQHTGQPSWDNLPAWTLEKQEGHDYKVGGSMGRRSWKVSLSFMADDNVFSKAGNENKFFTWNDPTTHGTDDEGEAGYTFDSSLSSFFKLTLNGKLPFIFCPDSSATDLEFALCRISNQPTFKQVANNMFSTSLTLVETY